MNESTPDDSFDDVLACIDIPSAPKQARFSSPAASSRRTELPSSSNQKNVPSGNQSVVAETSSTTISSHNIPVVNPKTAPNPHCIIVNPKQRLNPILKSILNVPMEFREIVADFVIGRTTCILYLSLKYHSLNSDYICNRLKELGKQYELRVLLVQVDTPEPHNALKSLTRISLLAELTLMLAWNADEAGRIIETYKLIENRPPDLIMERVESNPHQKLVSALTNIKPVNKTDAVTLLQNFGNLANIVNATEDRLSLVTGLGPRKAKKLYKTLQEPFLRK